MQYSQVARGAASFLVIAAAIVAFALLTGCAGYERSYNATYNPDTHTWGAGVVIRPLQHAPK